MSESSVSVPATTTAMRNVLHYVRAAIAAAACCTAAANGIATELDQCPEHCGAALKDCLETERNRHLCMDRADTCLTACRRALRESANPAGDAAQAD